MGFVGHKCADLQTLRGNAVMPLTRQDRQPENGGFSFRAAFVFWVWGWWIKMRFVGHKCADLQTLRGNAAMRLARQDRQPENRFPFFRLPFKPKQNPHFASSSETKCGFFFTRERVYQLSAGLRTSTPSQYLPRVYCGSARFHTRR